MALIILQGDVVSEKEVEEASGEAPEKEVEEASGGAPDEEVEGASDGE